MPKKIIYLLIPIFAVLLSVSLSSIASAADARNFNAGRIIDDAVFMNSNSMTVNEIQRFLDSKVTCDTWGAKKANKVAGSNETRAQWMKRVRGLDIPLRCIANYKENPATGESNYSRNADPAGAISAAQIIYNYSKQFNINPQVIIVTLQKENSLILDEWPNTKQFREAMGFGCPDNLPQGAPACDPTYGTFSMQVYEAARHFRGYIDNKPGWWVSFDTGWNDISWNPKSSCGTGSVYIENRATVALYSYTPYQPNTAAKNAQYGTGDGCSSYGNRNFYMYFTDWFGNTQGDVRISSSLKLDSSVTANSLFTGIKVSAKFKIKNNTSQKQDLGYVAVAGRSDGGANHDFGGKNIVLSPHEEYTFEESKVFSKEGDYRFWVTNYRDSYGWDDNFPQSASGVSRSADSFIQSAPVVTSLVDISPKKIHKGETVRVSFDVKNTSSRPVSLGYFGLAVKDPDGKNADLAFDSVDALGVGDVYNYAKWFTPKKTGKYIGRISGTMDDGRTWSEGEFPVSSVGDVELNAHPSITLIDGVNFLNSSTLRENGDTSASFAVKNFSNDTAELDRSLCLIVRSDSNKNYDYGCIDYGAISSGSTKKFNSSKRLPSGRYTAYLSSYYPSSGRWVDFDAPEAEIDGADIKTSFVVKPAISLVEGLSLSGDKIIEGQKTKGTFAIKNWGGSDVSVNKSLCYIIRGPNNYNNDLGCLDVGVIRAGETITYDKTTFFDKSGKYKAYFSMYENEKWFDNKTFEKETGSEVSSFEFDVVKNPVLSSGISISSSGGKTTGSFAIKNYVSDDVRINKSACLIVRKDGSNLNYDFGCLDIKNLSGNEGVTFSANKELPAGRYRAYLSAYDKGDWIDHWFNDSKLHSDLVTNTSFDVK